MILLKRRVPALPDPVPLVDPLRKFVLFTNAKAGGTTLKYWFLSNLELPSLRRRPHVFVGRFGVSFPLQYLRRAQRHENGENLTTETRRIRSLTNLFRRVYSRKYFHRALNRGFATIMVVRDPYERAVSSFLDKSCGEDRHTPWVQEVVSHFQENGEISFHGFPDYMEHVPEKWHNPHWRRQTFIVDTLDVEYFVRLEMLSEEMWSLARIVGERHP